MAIPTSCSGNGDRVLTATVPFGMLTSARRYAVDVADSSGNVTNAEDFTVELSVDVTGCSPAPLPSGVAIDPKQNIAAVTLFGCNQVALINMSTGTGSAVNVGTNPLGVAVIPRLHLAVVANNSGTASIVDELAHSVTQTVATGSGSIGAAADEASGHVAIANSVANTVSVIDAVTGGVSSISTGNRPVAVAYNYVNHQLAVAVTGGGSAATGGGSVGISTNGSSVSQSFNLDTPTSVVYDPVPTDCGSNISGVTTNTTGCFIANSSTGNTADVIDPVNSVQTVFRIGINPTAIAYNFLHQHAGQHQHGEPHDYGRRFPGAEDSLGDHAAADRADECGSRAEPGILRRAAIRRGYSSVHECRGDRGHRERSRSVRAAAALIGCGQLRGYPRASQGYGKSSKFKFQCCNSGGETSGKRVCMPWPASVRWSAFRIDVREFGPL